MPSLKDIKLKIDNFPFYNNIEVEYKKSNNLKGKKILKKKKILELYNNLYNSNNSILSPKKKEEQKMNSNIRKHKKGEIALSFTGNDTLNKIIITEMNNIKKNNFRIYKKVPDNISNIFENKYQLLNKQIYKLPLYNVKKILTDNINKNHSLYKNNDSEKINKFEDLKINSDNFKNSFPIIPNNKNFDSTDIKKENDKILKDLFKRNCLNRKKINKNILRINCLNKRAFEGNKMYNYFTQENNQCYNINTNDLLETNNGIQINTELKILKNRAKKLFIFNHNKTSDNMILSNEFNINIMKKI